MSGQKRFQEGAQVIMTGKMDGYQFPDPGYIKYLDAEGGEALYLVHFPVHIEPMAEEANGEGSWYVYDNLLELVSTEAVAQEPVTPWWENNP